MLEEQFVKEMTHLMSEMGILFFGLTVHKERKYFTKFALDEIPFEQRSSLLDDMQINYEKLMKTPWYI